MAVTAQGEFTFKDLRRGILFSVTRTWLTLLVVMAVSFGALAFMGYRREGQWSDNLPFVLAILFVLAFMVFYLFFLTYRTKRRNPNIQGLVLYEFDDIGFRTTGPHSRGEMRWSGIPKWRENKTTFLIYHSPRLSNIIPKRFFSSEQDVAAVQELLRTHVSKKK